jgi:hypothetical protein
VSKTTSIPLAISGFSLKFSRVIDPSRICLIAKLILFLHSLHVGILFEKSCLGLKS